MLGLAAADDVAEAASVTLSVIARDPQFGHGVGGGALGGRSPLSAPQLVHTVGAPSILSPLATRDGVHPYGRPVIPEVGPPVIPRWQRPSALGGGSNGGLREKAGGRNPTEESGKPPAVGGSGAC